PDTRMSPATGLIVEVTLSIGALPISVSGSDWRTALLAGCSNDISDCVSFAIRNFRFCISLTSVVFILSVDVPGIVTSSFPGGGAGACEEVQPRSDKARNATKNVRLLI